MRLIELEYEELSGKPEAWSVGPMQLGDSLLLTGRNAAGKSRTLTLLKSLADLLRGKRVPLAFGHYQVTFRHDSDLWRYELHTRQDSVVAEKLERNGQLMLTRGDDGAGEIRMHGAETLARFQVPREAVAALAKRDLYQHPYLELLHQWATDLRYYPFGSDMGKLRFAVLVKNGPQPDPADWLATLGLFRQAERRFGGAFKAQIIQKMARLDYDLEDVRLAPVQVEVVTAEPQLPGPLHWLEVKERELSCWTNQLVMSQGMFRALALMIHLAYAELSGQPGCILLDDIGEGLDFDRSAALIQLLLDVAGQHKVQVLMATNDRFVMNAVPLEHWGIIRRRASRCEILTYDNSRPMFEAFKLTGLSNFDLLRSGFFEDAPALH